MTRRDFRLRFAIVLAAAALLRLAFVLLVKRDDPLVGDEGYYNAQAVVIANGKWFENPFPPGGYAADHVPLTSLWLASVSWFDDRSVLAGRLLMALTGVAVVAGVGLLARLLFGRREAVIAAAVAAGYAPFWLNDAVLMSETLATGGVVAVLACGYLYHRHRAVGWAVALGVAMGLAGLARAELLVLGACVAIGMILVERGDVDGRDDAGNATPGPTPARRGVHLVAAATACVAIIGPWVVRNQIRFEESTIMSTQDGLTVLGANCPPSYSGDFIGFWAIECADLVPVEPDADQSVRSAAYREFGVDYALDHTADWPAVVAARVGRGLNIYRPDQMTQINVAEGRPRWASWIAVVQFWAFAPLAWFALRRWTSGFPRWPLLAAVGFTFLAFAAVYGIPRFRVPLDVVVVLGVAVAVERWWERRRGDATVGPAQS